MAYDDGTKFQVIFIGNYTDDVTYNRIVQKKIRDLSQASRLFQKRFIDSMARQDIVLKAVSIVPASSSMDLPDFFEERNIEVEVVSLEYGNVLSTFVAIKKLKSIVRELGDVGTSIVMYAVNPVGIIPILTMKNKFNLSLITICPELPQFRRYKRNIKNEIKRWTLRYFNRKFDKYIIFSEEMRKYLPKGKKYMLLEGFAPEVCQKPKTRKKNIALYAGGLAEDNGIRMMIEAAHRSELIDELWICGTGAALEYVKQKTDDKVKYLGRLSNEEVLRYESKAKVLLNVRDPQNELTRFSFPSKILEYMSAGGITISSKLIGIPQEYFAHMVCLEEYSVEGLKFAFDKVFSMSDAEYIQFTEKALLFVQTKQAEQRSREILNFILDKKELL